jgi:hypothetical protein
MTSVKFYRTLVFMVATIYLLDNYLRWGPSIFNYLTNWGLAAGVVCSSLLVYETYADKKLPINSVLIASFCLSAVVMVLYWRLYWKDPSLLYADKEHMMPWYRDDYVHLVGPLLQMFDALCIRQAFSGRVVKGLFYYCVIALSYSILSELVFALPYPFMWSLDFMQRLSFYGNGISLGIIAFFVGLGLHHVFTYSGLLRPAVALNGNAKP